MQNNDLISRTALLHSLNEQAPKPTTDDLYTVNLCIINAPAVDAVPVVRCKDCKYAHLNDDNECTYCDMISVLTDEGEPYYVPVFPPDWYCAYGEREDDV